MTILIHPGETPDTWWQAKNAVGRVVLDVAAEAATSAEARQAIIDGAVFQNLELPSLPSSSRDAAWDAVEAASRRIAAENPEDWPDDWVAHVAELADEMAARRDDPSRPGAWPNIR